MKRATYMRGRCKERVRRRAGISPVVATVIIVAVSIVLALVLAFWASGLITAFTAGERAEVRVITSSATQILLRISNAGSNTLEISAAGDIMAVQSGTVLTTAKRPSTCIGTLSFPQTIAPGGSLDVCVDPNADFTRGSTVEVIVVSSSGNAYRSSAFIP